MMEFVRIAENLSELRKEKEEKGGPTVLIYAYPQQLCQLVRDCRQIRLP